MVRLLRMPTYEYRCEACGHEFEQFQSIKDARLTDCPNCKKPKLERLISGGSFQLKGQGWGKDLYSSSKPSKPDEKKRSDNDRTDSLQKAVDTDKKKSEAA